VAYRKVDFSALYFTFYSPLVPLSLISSHSLCAPHTLLAHPFLPPSPCLLPSFSLLLPLSIYLSPSLFLSISTSRFSTSVPLFLSTSLPISRSISTLLYLFSFHIPRTHFHSHTKTHHTTPHTPHIHTTHTHTHTHRISVRLVIYSRYCKCFFPCCLYCFKKTQIGLYFSLIFMS
jgi:hypothetical protein